MTLNRSMNAGLGVIALVTAAGLFTGLSAQAGGGSGGHSAPAATPKTPTTTTPASGTASAPAKPATPTDGHGHAGGHDHGHGHGAARTAAVRVPAAELALTLLQEGNQRFTRQQTQGPNRDASRLKATQNDQQPFATILTCSDSRVSPEILFDRGIGELFVIRVAGNVCDVDEAGTIEYGTGHLGTPLVVVLGHDKCGAVKAVCTGAEVHGNIPGLVDNIIPAYEAVRADQPTLEGKALIDAVITENVWRSIEDLLTRSDEVRTLVYENRISVVGAVYDIATGEVRWMGRHPDETIFLSDSTTTTFTTAGQGAKPAPAAKPQAKTADADHGHHAQPHHR